MSNIKDRNQDKDLGAFLRILGYVWPQWPRLIGVFVSAVIIGLLFSLSFMTIGPLLKVMMGEEGLHGWVDRNICDWRYGMEFYVPEVSDFRTGDDDFRTFVQITAVAEDEPAAGAGLQPADRIIGFGSQMPSGQQADVPSRKLLEEMATIEQGDSVPIAIKRTDSRGNTNIQRLTINAPPKKSYYNWIQDTVSVIPRDETASDKVKAVTFIILAMVVITIARCIARFFQTYLASAITETATAHARYDCFTHILDMPVGYFSSEGTSDTVSRLIGDTAKAGKGIKVLLGKALREPMKAAGLLAGAMLISVKLTLIFACAAPAAVALMGLLGHRVRKATRKSLQSSARMLGRAGEVIAALRVVKVYNSQDREKKNFEGLNNRFLRQTLRVAKSQAATNPTMEVLGMIAGGAALILGVRWVAQDNLEASSFFLLLVLLGSAAESIRKVSDVWNKIQGANAACERVFSVIDSPLEKELPDARALPPVSDNVEFNDVWFTYPGNEAPTLKGVDLKVRAGQTVAIVGANGSGKTTLVNLLPRFYELDKGSIMIDGQDISRVKLASLREQIGMVTQNVVAFNDTVASNIAYGKPDATLGEIIQAAKSSYAHEFIEPLPEGYDTFIGENNAGFSGGQLQRIVIARAILKNPPILILDEATSQIDADSEAKIHKAMGSLMKDRTCFVIAHRFSTVVAADMIVVMEQGQIAAQGTHAELMESCRIYRNLYENQLNGAA
ncbi:Lipid A export ATP-binding/permease protein MsbA [Anaerohalosphaera lusitana]|uniref:Lipid A export ATP-binding/permease protein MsbA n=1 Tax=Anaerohalosphaera lusitana TaxID=1936003 RepID=A0A1U9NLG7_9BACT|nr:ABC transporter transmembrane domain-containing protein [Anaerohalosphaera lusitana]AQT68647.1 Lipid A export ATP-binding/permease protein MsbA [Anaerohalosphaera lusitana]